MSSLSWTAEQLRLAERFPDALTPRFNPRPPGVIRPGSATQVVLEYLRANRGKYFSHFELMKATGRSREAVTAACIYLRAQGLVATYPDTARNHRYHKYTVPRE